MELLLLHPGVARISCADCQKFHYDFQTGERKKVDADSDVDFERPPGCPPPCNECPKGSPEKEHETTLSAMNAATLLRYRESEATAGACLTEAERGDRLLARNFARIRAIVDRARRKQQNEELELMLLRLTIGGRR